MTKRASILIFLILLGWTSFSAGQGNAQATMEVSVRVVSGSSVEAIQSEILASEQGAISNVGKLTMRGVNEGEILISSTSKVILRNKEGDEVTMSISSRFEKAPSGSKNIQFEGTSKNQFMSSVYSGDLATTIEYL